MPYVTSVERFGIEKGIQIGIEQGRREGLFESIELAIDIRLGTEGTDLLPQIHSIQDADRLRAIHRAIMSANDVAEIRALVSAK